MEINEFVKYKDQSLKALQDNIELLNSKIINPLIYEINKLENKKNELGETVKNLQNETNDLNENIEKLQKKINELENETNTLNNKLINAINYIKQFENQKIYIKLLSNKKILEVLDLRENITIYELIVKLSNIILNRSKCEMHLERIYNNFKNTENIDLFNEIYESIIKSSGIFELSDIREDEIYNPDNSKSMNGEQVIAKIKKVIFRGYIQGNSQIVKNFVEIEV